MVASMEREAIAAVAGRRMRPVILDVGWLRELPEGVTARWDFAVAMAAVLVVGTGALIAALMGSATLATPAVVRVTYVGVIVLAVLACATLLVIEAGTEGVGPLAGAVSAAERDVFYAVSMGLASAILAVARSSLAAGGLVAAGSAGWLVGQVAYFAGVRDLRRMANTAVGVVVLAYLGNLVTGAASACPECTRGPWAIAAAGVGLAVGVVAAWASGLLVSRAEAHGAVGVGAVLFVMASTYFLVRDPVRATFMVLAIAGLSLVSVVPVRVLDRSRNLVIDVGSLAVAGLELLVGPTGTVPVGVVVLLGKGCRRHGSPPKCG